MSGLTEDRLKDSFQNLLTKLSDISYSMSPPEAAAFVTDMIKEASGVDDPYIQIKKDSNEAALSLYPELKKRVEGAGDPFREALLLSIAGNLIDYGAKADLDLDAALTEIMESTEASSGGAADKLFRFSDFKAELEAAEDILFLGDNAGEIVFDRVFIETLRAEFPGKKISFAVRGGPALNDALIPDALDVGLDKVADIISSGCAAAGTILPKCSEDFIERLDKADLVISKGQGNYESLSGSSIEKIWFLFRIKCAIVAESAGGPEGKLVLKKNACGILDPIA